MRKAKVSGQAVLCAIFSCIGLVNLGIWVWMTGKTKQRKLRLTGIILFVLCFVAIAIPSFVKDKKIEAAVNIVTVILSLVPMAVNWANLKTFINCQNLWSLVAQNQIQVNSLAWDAYADVGDCPDELMVKNSRRLFGDKGDAVLRAIHFKEAEKREMVENKKREAERVKTEAKRAEAERAKAEAEVKKLEAERVRAEAEVKKLEAEKLREENVKIEAEKVKAETAKIETEKAKAEAEKMRAEAELKKLELEKLKAEDETQQKEMQTETKVNQSIANNFRIGNKKIDINLCTEQELSLIPGIGIILAKKAIQIRNEKGSFKSVDEFIEEVGIRKNNEMAVRNNLECKESEQHVESSNKKRGRKIDL